MLDDDCHRGHRDRVRERIENGDIANLHEHEVLEYLLFSFIPRKDTNPIAHRLIEEFGSFGGVLNADPIHLKQVSGMTENASLFLSVLPEIFRHYIVSASATHEVRLSNYGEVRDYLGKLFIGLDVERAYAVALDKQYKVIGQSKWTSGKRDNVRITPSQIAQFADKTKAISVIIAHNHPSGEAIPSLADIDLTRKIWQALNLMEYSLEDHLIFNHSGECFSFKQNGYFQRWEDEIKSKELEDYGQKS